MSEIAKSMQNVAKAVENELPNGCGFFVLAYDNKNPACYVSNSNRSDVLKAMNEFIERNEFPNQNNN